MRRGEESDAEPLGHRLAIEGEGHAPVSGIMVEAADPVALLVLGHGAGAPMTHPFMEALALALSAEGISTLRYNFAYMEAGRRRPDHLRRLLAVVASALQAGRERAVGVPLFAGGKSMGGRMTSTLVARGTDTAPDGLVFFGFPLHAPGKRGSERGEHLARVQRSACPQKRVNPSQGVQAEAQREPASLVKASARPRPYCQVASSGSCQGPGPASTTRAVCLGDAAT